MTLVLSEESLSTLLSMPEVVAAVEESFWQEAASRAVNSPRRKTHVPGSLFSVMHASLPYLGRAGVKCYVTSQKGTKFVFVLFSLSDAAPLMVCGADMLGRFRTGAASAVATKHLSSLKSFRFALAGAGRQALTQVLAMREVAALESTAVWSPDKNHRDSLVRKLSDAGVDSKPASGLEEAFVGSEVATAITSSKDPFIESRHVATLTHLNVCGSNSPDRSECTPAAVALFKTVVVDDLEESKEESGDLILAQRAGTFDWGRAVELKDVVSGSAKGESPSLFKSNGVAIEDVAVASMIYEKAKKRGEFSRFDIDLVG